MSYRNIKVNDVDYRYVIGKKVTKIQKVGDRNFKLFDNKVIGNMLGQSPVITPAVIRDLILGNPVPRELHCRCHNVTTTTLTYDPYELEINETRRVMIACQNCVDDREMDI